MEDIVIEPQPAQMAFLSSPADIAIFGGAAGGGKTWSLLADGCRLANVEGASAVLFKKQSNQITGAGNIWEAATEFYSKLDATFKLSPAPKVTFENGSTITFGHLSEEVTKLSYQGAELSRIYWEELVQENGFTETQFLYLMTRLRTKAKIRPVMRGTCNPLGRPHWFRDNWLLPAGFIHPEGHPRAGFPVAEMRGVLMYFLRIEGITHWAKTAEELLEKFPHKKRKHIMSFTFINSTLADNKYVDEDYEAKLDNQSPAEREALLSGNWFVDDKPGDLFDKSKVTIVDSVPHASTDLVAVCRGNDLAATEVNPSDPSHDPDYSASVSIGRLADGRIIILDCYDVRYNSADVITKMVATGKADMDYVNSLYHVQETRVPEYKFSIPQDPGSAGVTAKDVHLKALHGEGIPAFASLESGKKRARALPLSAVWNAGKVLVLKGPWNERFLSMMHVFDGVSTIHHDDIPDAASRAYNTLFEKADMWAAL